MNAKYLIMFQCADANLMFLTNEDPFLEGNLPKLVLAYLSQIDMVEAYEQVDWDSMEIKEREELQIISL